MTWLATIWNDLMLWMACRRGAADQATKDRKEAADAMARVREDADRRSADAVTAAAAQDAETASAHNRIREDIANAETHPQVVTDPALLAALRGLRARQAARRGGDPAA
jgi:hypothetical protein